MRNVMMVFVLLVSTSIFAEVTLGKGASFKDATSLETVLKTPTAYLGKELTLVGTVAEVCEMKGCWMNLTVKETGAPMKIKVQDGKIVIPVTARGKQAAAFGKLHEVKMDRAQTIKYLEHQALDLGKKFDPKSVKENLSLYQLDATGISIE